MPFTRREFLERGVILVPASVLASNAMVGSLLASPSHPKRNLVFVELRGGNDGLNTVVPYGFQGGIYYDHRPTLGVPADAVLPIDDEFGFHPALGALLPHWDAGRLAIVRGVGFPNPSFSHAFARKVFATGDPTGATSSGWFGRFLNASPAPEARVFDVNRFVSSMFAGAAEFVPAFLRPKNLSFPGPSAKKEVAARRRAYEQAVAGLAREGGLLGDVSRAGERFLESVDTYSAVPKGPHVGLYPAHPLGHAMRLVKDLIASPLPLRYHHVVFGGFDTHSGQDDLAYHEARLEVVAGALAAFQADLTASGDAKKTVTVVYSEFGRSVLENGSGGTDHGTAGLVLVLGAPVSGGFVDPHPSLHPGDLSDISELEVTTDFRDVFGTLLERWLGFDAAGLFPGHVVADLGFI